VVTPEGFPLSYEVFEGNRADVTTLEEMLDVVERRHGQPVGCGSLTAVLLAKTIPQGRSQLVVFRRCSLDPYQ
jgi:hypothetical protein